MLICINTQNHDAATDLFLCKTAGLCLCLWRRNDGTEFGGSIYQKVNDDLETAVNLSWTAGNSSTRFGIAAKYMLDSSSSISVSYSEPMKTLAHIIWASLELTGHDGHF